MAFLKIQKYSPWYVSAGGSSIHEYHGFLLSLPTSAELHSNQQLLNDTLCVQGCVTHLLLPTLIHGAGTLCQTDTSSLVLQWRCRDPFLWVICLKTRDLHSPCARGGRVQLEGLFRPLKGPASTRELAPCEVKPLRSSVQLCFAARCWKERPELNLRSNVTAPLALDLFHSFRDLFYSSWGTRWGFCCLFSTRSNVTLAHHADFSVEEEWVTMQAVCYDTAEIIKSPTLQPLNAINKSVLQIHRSNLPGEPQMPPPLWAAWGRWAKRTCQMGTAGQSVVASG